MPRRRLTNVFKMATLRAPQAHYKREGRSVILADGTALILVDRLRAVFWPRIVRTWMTDTRDVPPQMDYIAESSRHAHKDYDRGRILHFANWASCSERSLRFTLRFDDAGRYDSLRSPQRSAAAAPPSDVACRACRQATTRIVLTKLSAS